MKYLVTAIRIIFLALFVFLFINGNMFLWLALYGATLLLAPFFGRIYCGYICPINTLMIPVEWVSKKLNIQSTSQPKWLKNGYFAWIGLVLSVIGMILSKRFLHITLPIIPIWIVIAMVITIRFKPEVFHNLICPFGALQRVFGKFAFFSKKVNKNLCVGCKLCEKACPSQSIVVSSEDHKASINYSLCHQCNNCKEVCPKDAISYGKKVNKTTLSD